MTLLRYCVLLGRRLTIYTERGACKYLRQGCGQYKEVFVSRSLRQLWYEERGQDIAEYAVMLAVVLVIVVGTIRLIGSNANNVFSSVASAIQQ